LTLIYIIILMEKIIKNNNLIFTTITPIITEGDNGDITKKYIPKFKGWKDMSHKECLKKADDNDTHFLIKCNNNFIIFDTDTRAEFNKLVETFKELNLLKDVSMTRSTRGDEYTYKRHFWFSVEDEEFKNMKKHYFDKLEVFIGDNCNIVERRESTLDKIKTLSYEDYLYIKQVFELEIQKVEIKPVIKTENPEDQKLITLLDGLKSDRWDNFDSWIRIYWVFVNEKLNLDIFKMYSEKSNKYNEEKNEKILSNAKICEGFKIATIHHYVKEDNEKLYKSLQKDRTDFWDMFETLKSHSDPAKFYYSLNPNKYILSPSLGWLEYGNNNVLKVRGDKPPVSMLNHITKTFQDQLLEQRNFTLPTSSTDIEYKNKMKIFQNAYNKVGTASYIEGVIKYLAGLYMNDKIDELLDANKDLVAFDNMLYDNKIKDFRPIKPTDYITKTTRYSINTKSNKPLRETLIKLIKTMFDNDDIYNYHLKTISLSLFGNRTESFIINSGKGRNGKGVCSALIENAFGDYFYSGESTFLTTVYKADRPNSTLYNLRGVRYFLTTEPEADNETKFNIGLIKKITGNDTITTRDLNKSNISYKPQFTPFLQCNTKPKIDTIDDAIKNRFRIINFPFAFVSNPTKPNEKQGNNNLKDLMTPEMFNEFMLLLLDINKNQELVIPKAVLSEVDDYLNTNNFVKSWLDGKFDYTDDKKDCFTGKELLLEYNSSGDYPILNNIKFNEYLRMNNIPTRILKGNKYYYGLKLKEQAGEINDFDI